MKPGWGNAPVNDDLPEVADKEVDRIDVKQLLAQRRETVDGVEDGRQVHEQHGEHVIQVLDVPEEDEEGGEDHSHSDIKEDEAGDGVEQAEELPGEGQAVQGHEYKKYH